jgi:hypothetical protein
MSDMRKLLESMNKFAGEPEQRPGDQVRGTEPATKKKSGKHPFQGRLVGGESVIRELEKQLVEGELERRLREEFEQFNEFAPPRDDSSGDDGFSDETLKRLAAQWWQGDEDPRIEKTLAAAGWEIGQDEGYDNGGVFVVQSGDVNGNSYISWPAEELEGLGEAINLGTLRSAVGAKQEPDEFAAKLLARRQQQQAQAPREKVYRGPEEYRKEKAVAEKQINELGANNPPQQNSAVTGTATTSGAAAPVNPKDAAALKQSLMKLKTSVPGLDVTKAVTTMAKADTGTQLNPADQKIASAIAPQLANVMKNPQMATSLKMMIDKADQQEKAAAAKPPGTL